VSDGIVLEIERNRIIDDADKPGGSHRPTVGAAGLVESGMHDLNLMAQPFGWHGDPHPDGKPPFRLRPRLIRCSYHSGAYCVHDSFEWYKTGAALSRWRTFRRAFFDPLPA